MAIGVKTESIDITLNFDNGDSGTFYCFPNQKGFFDKLTSLGEKIEKRLKEIDMNGIEIDQKGELKSDENIDIDKIEDVKNKLDIIEKANKVFEDEIDDVLSVGASAVIFKYNSPMSYHNGYGTYYALGILGDITNEIMEKLKMSQADKINEHIQK